jgi:hypothetical protein
VKLRGALTNPDHQQPVVFWAALFLKGLLGLRSIPKNPFKNQLKLSSPKSTKHYSKPRYDNFFIKNNPLLRQAINPSKS